MSEDGAFELPAAYREHQADARRVAIEAEPLAVEADASNSVHPGVHSLLARSELWRLLVPRPFGGRDETIDPLAICVVREQLMARSSHLDSLFALQGIGSYAITAGGSERLKAEWLPKVASGDALAALALTEPDAGSDLKAIETELTERGGRMLITGRKSFISNGGAAAFYSVLAREGDDYSMVLVPAGSDGLEVTPTPELIAPHVLADLRFDDVEVDARQRLGPPGQGFELVLATLAVFRVSVAGASLGLAQRALDEAVAHAKRRRQFGRPLAKLGAVTGMLADSWAELEAARLLTYRAAVLARDGAPEAGSHAAMAKLVASETAGRVVDRAVQIMGRFGLVRDSTVERLYRQARPMRIYEGASEVLKVGIARTLFDDMRG